MPKMGVNRKGIRCGTEAKYFVLAEQSKNELSHVKVLGELDGTRDSKLLG